MDNMRETLLTKYTLLDDEGKANIAAYIDILSAKASLQSAMDDMNAQEAELLASLISSLSNALRTQEAMALLRALSERLTEIQAHALPMAHRHTDDLFHQTEDTE